jgi:hypothetical protein
MSTSLTWREVTIPDSSPPVAVARLREDADGAFWALVRFPAGWSRPVVGHYVTDEEFWLLEGELTMSGVTYSEQQGDRIPAGRPRADSRSERGALALARFAGPPTWVRS